MSSTTLHDPGTVSHRKTAFGLLGAAFCFYAVFAPMGQFPSDTFYSIATAQALYARHTMAIVKDVRLRQTMPGRGGREFSKYGPANALLFLPGVPLAHVISRPLHCSEEFLGRALLSFSNTFFAAGCVALLYLIFLSLGYSQRPSRMAALSIACASILLPYSKIVFAETPTTFLLLVFAYIMAKNAPLEKGQGVLLGLVFFLLVWFKIANGIYGLFIGWYALDKLTKRQATVPGLAALGAIGLASLLGLCWLNWLRFGRVFDFGYGGEAAMFTTRMDAGLLGLLFSPSRSIFLFSPLLCIALAGVRPLYKKQRFFSLCLLGMALGSLIFYAKWHDWKGGWAWGPRLLVPAIVVMHCFIIDFVNAMRTSIVRRTIFWCLFVPAFAVNVLGSLVWYQQVHAISDDYWSWPQSHIVIASKLFMHKLEQKPEIYRADEFDGVNRLPMQTGKALLDFTGYKTFRGFATIWNGLYVYQGWRWIMIVPVLLFLFSVWLVIRIIAETDKIRGDQSSLIGTQNNKSIEGIESAKASKNKFR